MVCKEDVLSWFKDLESYKRIDVMCELLNMCTPFEIRFMGSCIEEIGKHSYQELHGLTVAVNDVEKLSKDNLLNPGLLDESTRSRVLLLIPLLSSRNCSSANWLFKKLLRTDVIEDFIVKGNCNDDNLQSELLLLLTMGLYHPAFTFDQKTYFGRLLVHLLKQREGKSRISPKSSVSCYPPGFGYPIAQKYSVPSEVPVIPVKTASQMATGDTPCQHQPPPGFPAYPVTQLELIWQRPAFAGNICGAPEVAPFPPHSLSPLVSQPTSPPLSRAASPHRSYPIRTLTAIPPPLAHAMDVQSMSSQLSMESLSQSSLPPFNPDLKSSEDELNHIQEDKMRDAQWISQFDFKQQQQPNGIRLQCVKGTPYYIEQMKSLNLEGENSLHCSTSSSNNSLNQSPPMTPVTSSVTPHGPGRGEKTRVNGIPPFINAGPPAGPSMCESTPPPPFSNCTVPYTNFPIPALPPNRLYPYSFRPSLNPQYTYPAENIYPYFYSRTANCYNCGALGHLGADCSAQTIEDITQKAYTLEYSSPLPDTDK